MVIESCLLESAVLIVQTQVFEKVGAACAERETEVEKGGGENEAEIGTGATGIETGWVLIDYMTSSVHTHKTHTSL